VREFEEDFWELKLPAGGLADGPIEVAKNRTYDQKMFKELKLLRVGVG
jgi:hypothetical protein